MSVDKWAYDPEKCDGKECMGDCDFCEIWKEDKEQEHERSRDI